MNTDVVAFIVSLSKSRCEASKLQQNNKEYFFGMHEIIMQH